MQAYLYKHAAQSVYPADQGRHAGGQGTEGPQNFQGGSLAPSKFRGNCAHTPHNVLPSLVHALWHVPAISTSHAVCT